MEDLFRTQMDSYKVDPSPGLWQKLSIKILLKQFFSFSLQTFNMYYLAAAISLAGFGTYMLFSDSPDHVQEETIQSSTDPLAVKPSESSSDLPVMTPENEESTTETSEERVISPIETSQTKKREPQRLEVADDPISDAKLSSENPVQKIEQDEDISEDNIKKSKNVLVTVDFNASELRGCSPLPINFQNTSENAVKYFWTFGDGGSSAEKDPAYVFDEPGEYVVSLKIIGTDGIDYSVQKTIEVFETPKALFEMEEAVDNSGNQPVYFYNYSRGAEYFQWTFGDQQQSDLAEPIHFYEKTGSYNVKLKVWTDKQCYDSLIVINALTGPESEIKFPNAFTPNMSGPIGGYYEVNDISNTVFHPISTGELQEYQLKVFNRHGLQVFESNDVSFGWDGYYQEKLAAQGVYIWKARGKFSNGQSFVKSGDVTLIRTY